MDALILDAPAGTAHVQRVPIPEPANDDLLVRVYAIALNPVDALYTAKPLGKSGRIVGSDFAGVVEKRGPAPVASGSIEIGHRVAGFLQGGQQVSYPTSTECLISTSLLRQRPTGCLYGVSDGPVRPRLASA